MGRPEPGSATINLSALVDAFEFVSASELEENRAYICRKTGKIVFVSDFVDAEEEDPPEDVMDSEAYEPVPHRRELDLGKKTALRFTQEELPGSLPEVRGMFSRRGAYSHFKHLLRENGVLEKWYAFEEATLEAALRAWCDDVGIVLDG